MPQSALALWTGISAFAGQQQSDWELGPQLREADIFSYGLSIEEKTRPGLRIGAGAGQFDLRLKDRNTLSPIEDFDGQFFLFYLRWPFQLGESLTLHTRFDYQYHSGNNEDLNQPRQDINWTDIGFHAGLALRIDTISLQPFLRYRLIDGDITSDTASRLLQHHQDQSYGLMLDIHVESTAYVRLQASLSAVDSLSIHFVRAY